MIDVEYEQCIACKTDLRNTVNYTANDLDSLELLVCPNKDCARYLLVTLVESEL